MSDSYPWQLNNYVPKFMKCIQFITVKCIAHTLLLNKITKIFIIRAKFVSNISIKRQDMKHFDKFNINSITRVTDPSFFFSIQCYVNYVFTF